MTDRLLSNLRALQTRITLDKRHIYRKDKEWRPAVTRIVKVIDAPFLDAWKVRVQVEATARAAYECPPIANEPVDAFVSRLCALAKQEYEHERLASEAADVGKQVHALIEHAVRVMLGDADPVAAPPAGEEALFRFAGWKQWSQRVGLRPLMAEGRIHHPELNYCGTFDLLAEIDGRVSVLDWKPTETLWPERRLQSVAYRGALHAMGWPYLIHGHIVSMPRDGGDITIVPVENSGDDYETAFSMFERCLGIFHWLRSLDRERKESAA